MRVFIAILLILGFAATDLRAQDRPARDDRERPDKPKADREPREHRDYGSARDGADTTATGATIDKDDDEPATQPLSCWDRPGGCNGPPQPLCVPPKVWSTQRAACVSPAPPRIGR